MAATGAPGAPEAAKELLRKCDGCDAAKVVARKHLHKTAWSKVQEALSVLADYRLPLATKICLAQRFVSDSAKDRNWRAYTAALELRGLTEDDDVTFDGTAPAFKDCIPDEEDHTSEYASQITDRERQWCYDSMGAWDYWKKHFLKAVWSSVVFQLFEEVRTEKKQLLLYAEATVAAIAIEGEVALHIQDAAMPALRVARCVGAVLNCEPFALGSTPEDVWYCMGEPKKDSKAKRPKAALLALPEAAGIAAELRNNPEWQDLYDKYCDVCGTEAQYGEAFLAFLQKAKAKSDALARARLCDDNEEGVPTITDKVKTLLEADPHVDEFISEFSDNATWWREHFREECCDNVDVFMHDSMTAKWEILLGAGTSGDEEDIKKFKKLCKYCGDDALVAAVTQAQMKKMETDQNNAITAACQKDLNISANMVALVAAMRTCEFMKKDDATIDALKIVIEAFGTYCCKAITDFEITAEVTDRILAALPLFCQEEALTNRLLISKDALVKETEAFSQICKMAAKVKQAGSDIVAAAKTEDSQGKTMKAAVISMHKTLVQAKQFMEKPPKFGEDSLFVSAARKLCTMALEWIRGGGASGGCEGVLHKYASEVIKKDAMNLKAAAEELLKIAGGCSGGKSWKEGLKANCGWTKITEAWNAKLKECDGAGIEAQLNSLKQDTTCHTHTHTHIACGVGWRVI